MNTDKPQTSELWLLLEKFGEDIVAAASIEDPNDRLRTMNELTNRAIVEIKAILL